MPAISLDDLVPYVITDVPGAPENMVKLRMREALREFCLDTEAWTEKVVMNQVADQSSYTITLTNDAMIERILWVKAKTSASQDFDDVTVVPVSYYYLGDDGDTVEFYNQKELNYTITNGVEFKFALRPTFQTEELSGDLIDRYGEGIFNLTKYKLMSTPQTPYYNPQLAQMHYDNYYKNTRVTAIREKTVQHKAQGLVVQPLGGILG